MPELSLESLVELVAMVVLSTIGLLAERAGLASLASGPDPAAIWLLAIGAVALYAGVYMLGYQRLFRRLVVARGRRS